MKSTVFLFILLIGLLIHPFYGFSQDAFLNQEQAAFLPQKDFILKTAHLSSESRSQDHIYKKIIHYINQTESVAVGSLTALVAVARFKEIVIQQFLITHFQSRAPPFKS